MADPPDPAAVHAQQLMRTIWNYYDKVKLHGIQEISTDTFLYLLNGAAEEVAPESMNRALFTALRGALLDGSQAAIFQAMSTFLRTDCQDVVSRETLKCLMIEFCRLWMSVINAPMPERRVNGINGRYTHHGGLGGSGM